MGSADVTLPPVKQLGMVVTDAERTARTMQALLGWGPFMLRDIEINNFRFRGEIGSCVIKVAIGYSGPVEIEFIEVVRGSAANPYSEFLRQHGEGIHHIRLDSTLELSVAEQLAVFAQHGIQPFFQVALRWDDWEVEAAYVDARQSCGLVVEVSGPPRLIAAA